MFEPDVTLTDFAVAIECALLAFVLFRGAGAAHGTRRWLALLIAAGGLASFIGGVVHGFVPDKESLAFAILWRATMLILGVTTFSLWAAAASLLPSRLFAHWLMVAACVLLALYAVVILFVSQQFVIGIAVYVPAVLFMLAVLAWSYRQAKKRDRLVAISGFTLTILAAVLQQLHVGIHPVYFNYNALFHVLNGVSMFVIFWAARSLAPAKVESDSPLVAGQALV
jgi:hypothetical protein